MFGITNNVGEAITKFSKHGKVTFIGMVKYVSKNTKIDKYDIESMIWKLINHDYFKFTRDGKMKLIKKII